LSELSPVLWRCSAAEPVGEVANKHSGPAA
jgi:hypothetical protein